MSHVFRTPVARMVGTSLLVLPFVAAIGCSKPSKGPATSTSNAASGDVKKLSKQVRKMDKRLKKIERLLAQYLNAPPEPDPAAVYSIPIDGDPYKGEKDAKVTVVKAFEFACGFCFKATATMKELLEGYKGKIKIAYKYFIVHDVALDSGRAACAANKQGKFGEFESLVWEKAFQKQDISAKKMTELATELKLDVKKFEEDAKSQACTDWIKNSQKKLALLGTSGTPAFYINGRFLSGAQPLANFKKLIDEELAKADKVIAAGTPVADYYRKYVVEKGLKELKKPDDDDE